MEYPVEPETIKVAMVKELTAKEIDIIKGLSPEAQERYISNLRGNRLKQARKVIAINSEYYSCLRSLLGNDWAIYYFMLGGRGVGKSYAVTDYFVGQFKRYGRPFYWLRLTDKSMGKLLKNNAQDLVDPDLRRKYNLDLVTNGDCVYNVIKRDSKGKIKEKKLMARVLALSTFYDNKGQGLYDKDFLNDPAMYYNICLDEMNREKNERNSFSIVYAFSNEIENIVRNTDKRIRIICIGNTLGEASDLLCALNFIPENYGRFNVRKKRAVVEYMPMNDTQKDKRAKSPAGLIAGEESTFTNECDIDTTLVTKQRLFRPSYVIAFSKNKDKWFTVWDDNIVAKYNNEQVPVYPMRPYLDTYYEKERVMNIIELFDTRCYRFHRLIVQKKFKSELELLKPRKG